MAEFFANGHAIDLVMAFVLLEAVLLYVIHRRTGRGVTPGALLRLLVPGACLLLAVRAALTGASWMLVALWLILSLIAHLADLKQRWSE